MIRYPVTGEVTPGGPLERNCKSLIGALIDFGAGSGHSQAEFACAIVAMTGRSQSPIWSFPATERQHFFVSSSAYRPL